MKVTIVSTHNMCDRRTVQQVQALRAAGYEVTFANPYWQEDAFEITLKDKQSTKKIVDNFVQSTSLESISGVGESLRSVGLLNKIITSKPVLRLYKYMRRLKEDVAADNEAHLLKRACEQKADIYQACDLITLSSAVKAAKANGSKVVYDSHELYYERGQDRILRRKLHSMEKKYIGAANAVITVNQYLCDVFVRRYRIPRPTEIYSMFDATRFPHIAAQTRSPYERYSLAPNAKVLLFQGNISAVRNVDTIIEMMKYVRSPEAVLFIIGGGDYFEKAKKLAQDNGVADRVYFVDRLEQDELFWYTRFATIGLISYLASTKNMKLATPSKLFEYIGAQLPIAYSDLPEVRRIIEKEGVGRMVDFSDPVKAAQGIDAMLDDEKGLARMKERLVDIKEEYSWEHEAKRYVAVFDKLAGK